MNRSWTRLLKSAYRKQPLLSFVATAGAVNVAIGGLGEHWSLMTLGLGAAGLAIALYGWQRQKRPAKKHPAAEPPQRPAIYALPPAPNSSLPPLNLPRKPLG